jgi:hypothetical protein
MKRIAAAALVVAGSAFPRPAHAYIEAPYPLGKALSETSNVLVVQVEKVDKEKNQIIYRKVQDLKGKHPTDVIRHNIAKNGFHPREWQTVMALVEPGKLAVIFHNGGASETCLDTYWYQCYARAGTDWWDMSHSEPFFLRTFAGKPDKLGQLVIEIQAGREVIVPAMVDGNKDDLHLRRAKIQRLRASLKIQDYNPQRDFMGWGGDDFKRVLGMPGFTHLAVLPRVDPCARGAAVADIDGDGVDEICLFGETKVALLKNEGNAFREIPLPFTGGARAAAWADYNGDGKLDLLLAAPSGVKLLTNLGASFRDDSAALPQEPYGNVTAAVWIDYDGDGRPDILVANGFLGLRLYRNVGPAAAGAPTRPFEDVSERAGLGPDGAAGRLRGDHLATADVDGDGRMDFLYSAGEGVLVLNTPRGFVEARDGGIRYRAGHVTPVFGDFDGSGKPGLFVPQPQGPSKLFRNDGKGRFTDVTASAGDLARPLGQAVGAAWVDLEKRGKPDLVVACLRGPNLFFRNLGGGRFADAGESLGFYQRAFHSRGIAALDLNKDGVGDLVFVNEGAEPVALLGDPARAGGR